MNHLFDKYRDKKASQILGFYSHRRVPLLSDEEAKTVPYETNEGLDLESKLKFLSSVEYIITNTYHGVYWGHLLNRKVIAMPHKSGMYSFKHRPVYSVYEQVNEDTLKEAKNYPDALEESRALNRAYYQELINQYPLL